MAARSSALKPLEDDAPAVFLAVLFLAAGNFPAAFVAEVFDAVVFLVAMR
jgi:hypothetical protein